MGEAMAGVVHSGRDQQVWPEGEEKSDHFVGSCYADYVTAGRAANGGAADDGAEDSVARESSMYNDKADELMMRVLGGDQEALELWSKTRAWVISGQRKTLARLGIAFDKVIFESDFLPEVPELTNKGLSEGTLTKRYGDDMVMYETEREELEEMPLVRSDGLPTQHMRALAYWAAGARARRLHLAAGLRQRVGRPRHLPAQADRRARGRSTATATAAPRAAARRPTTSSTAWSPANRTSITSSKEGALLIDDLAEWLEREIEADPERAEVRRSHPDAGAAAGAGRARLLPPAADHQAGRLRAGEAAARGARAASAGTWRGRRRTSGTAASRGERPAEDPDYRFAVVQSELYRRHLRSAVEDLDVDPAGPLRLPLRPLVPRRASARRRSSGSCRRCSTQGVRGLGLEGA